MTRNASVELSISTWAYPQFTGPAKNSARMTFLNSPTASIISPSAILRESAFRREGSLSWGMNSPCRRMGPMAILGKYTVNRK